MKIAFITCNLAPFRIDWLDELAKLGNEITIYTNDIIAQDVNIEYINRMPVNCQYIRLWDKKYFNHFRKYQFKKIFEKDFDILLLDGYGFLSQMILIILLKIKHKKFVMSIDGGLIPENENKLKFYIKHLFISSAFFYLSTSLDTDQYLIHYGVNINQIFRHKFTSIYKNEIVKETLNKKEKQAIREKIGIKDKFTILGVGKFIKRKGFDTLIKAINLLDDDIQVILIGGEPPELYFELSNKETLKKVTYIKFLKKEELLNYYKASDLFVLPTREDVWGLVINEALSMGIPTITTNRCIAGVTLIENEKEGFIIDVDDYRSLAEKIKKVKNNEILQHTMSKNCIKKALQYTIEISASEDYKSLSKIYSYLKENL